MWFRRTLLFFILIFGAFTIYIIISFRNQKTRIFETGIAIEAPRSSTWESLIDTSGYKSWVQRYHSLVINSGQLNRLGSSYTIKYLNNNGEFYTSEKKITRIKPYSWINYTLNRKGVEEQVEYILEDLSLRETNVTFHHSIKYQNFLQFLLDNLSGLNQGKLDESQLLKLKEFTEANFEERSGPVNKKRVPAVRIPK